MRVTIEIVPFGREQHAHVIRQYEIGNTGTQVNGRYLYNVYEGSRWADANKNSFRWPDDTVWHKRSDGPERLAMVVLRRLRRRRAESKSGTAQVHGTDSERDGRERS